MLHSHPNPIRRTYCVNVAHRTECQLAKQRQQTRGNPTVNFDHSFRHGQMEAKICLSFQFQRSIDQFEEVRRATDVKRDRTEKRKNKVERKPNLCSLLLKVNDSFGARDLTGEDFDCLLNSGWRESEKVFSSNGQSSRPWTLMIQSFCLVVSPQPSPRTLQTIPFSDNEGFKGLFFQVPTNISSSSSDYKKCNQISLQYHARSPKYVYCRVAKASFADP